MDTNRQRLVSAARRLLRTPADAEDAVQDTYLRALSASRAPSLPQAAWLHAVLRNTAIDRLRRKQMEAAHAEIKNAHLKRHVKVRLKSGPNVRQPFISC